MDADPWAFGWEALVAIGTLLLALGTLALAVVTWRLARTTTGLVASTERATAVEVATGLVREFRALRPQRHRVERTIKKYDPVDPVRDFDEPDRDDVYAIAHFLDSVGFLIERDFVTADLISGFMGISVVHLWEQLGPHIAAERERREQEGEDPRYQIYFENLAERMRGTA